MRSSGFETLKGSDAARLPGLGPLATMRTAVRPLGLFVVNAIEGLRRARVWIHTANERGWEDL
jgi:hypothetical protein